MLLSPASLEVEFSPADSSVSNMFGFDSLRKVGTFHFNIVSTAPYYFIPRTLLSVVFFPYPTKALEFTASVRTAPWCVRTFSHVEHPISDFFVPCLQVTVFPKRWLSATLISTHSKLNFFPSSLNIPSSLLPNWWPALSLKLLYSHNQITSSFINFTSSGVTPSLFPPFPPLSLPLLRPSSSSSWASHCLIRSCPSKCLLLAHSRVSI